MVPDKSTQLAIEVAYAKPDSQVVIKLNLAASSTVAEAIMASGVLDMFPDLDINTLDVGVFGKVCTLEQVLKFMIYVAYF